MALQVGEIAPGKASGHTGSRHLPGEVRWLYG